VGDGGTPSGGYVARIDFFANGELVGSATRASTNGTYRYSWRVSVRRSTRYRFASESYG
jgi:hypothetical protein